MPATGIVHITLHCDARARRVNAARVTLQRPSVARLLIGRAPDEAAELVRALHAVCGAAHRLAARRAIRDARRAGTAADHGSPGPRPVRPDDAAEAWDRMEREALVGIAFDHLCRLYIDWPAALELPVQPAEVVAWRRRFADPPGAIRDGDIDAVRRHAHALTEVVPAAAGIRRRLRRRARETLVGLTAIKLEPERPGKIRRIVTPAAGAATRGAGASTGDGPWHGEGRTLTARGELIHRVSLVRDAQGREAVAAWTIDAPTDRLFVPDGPVAHALTQLRGDRSSLQRLARFVVLSFDPCVESRIELRPPEAADARDVARPGNP